MQFDHECPEWDYMRIDESCFEFFCCPCYKTDDAKIFKNMHNDYQNNIQQAWKKASYMQNLLDKIMY